MNIDTTAPARPLLNAKILCADGWFDGNAIINKIAFLSDYGITPSTLAINNTTAMQTLMNNVSAAGGGVIHCGVGIYNFLTLKPKSKVKIKGVVGQTIFFLDGLAASGDDLFSHNEDGLDGSLDDFSLDSLILDGNHRDGAFVIYGCNRLRMADVIFRNAGTYGCGLQSRPGFTITLPQDDIIFTRCGFVDNGSDAPGWDGLDIKWSTNAKLIACWATGNTDVGLNVRGRDVDLIGCVAKGNGTAGILLQSNDSTENSHIRVVGGGAVGTTAGPGLEIQGTGGLNTYVNVAGFQTYENIGTGCRISGLGKVYGTLDIQSRDNTLHGFEVTGDYVGHLVVSGLITGNDGDGVNTTGKNLVCDGLHILANTGVGYKENVNADNNYIMPSCVIDGNTGGNIGTRVGVETQDGFMSVRSTFSLRAFPGKSSGLELQTDGAGLHSSLVSVGDATSIDFRMLTKGNGTVGVYKDNGARQIGLFRAAGSASVNYPDFIASLTGTPIQLNASGTDTDIDLQLTPKGSNGRVRVGTLTASADAPVTGYIEIKDAGGTLRKLAIIG